MTSDAAPSRRPAQSRRVRPGILIALLTIGAAILIVVLIGAVTPRPSAMLIRSVFEKGGAETVAEMKRHLPATPVTQRLDVPYADEEITTMDVFTTTAPGEVRPTVIWVHGGAWIAGSKAEVAPYLQILAAQGYTTIGLNYSLGPEAEYPTAVHQLNTALAYINEHAAELGVDKNQIVLAGDSAGGQLASQLAMLITHEEYAHLLGMTPALSPAQLSGLILNCGVYDLPAMAEIEGLVAWGFQVSLWAYTGTKNWSASSAGATMSTINFVNADLPPTFISGGNGDGLTWLQSIPMARAMQDAGVDVTSLFWPMDHSPTLGHEYQFHLDLPEAQEALEATIQYLGRVTK